MGRTGKQSNWRDQSCACHVVPIQSLKDFPGSIVDSAIGLFERSQLSRLKLQVDCYGKTGYRNVPCSMM